MNSTYIGSLSYRPDIDGLRAFAVLSVILFHAFPDIAFSGFIGVDVFFVISGYLIGGIILKDLENGTFSFQKFYARRIRRIFPALITILVFALIFGWLFLLQDEYKTLGKYIFSGSFFVSNIHIWQEIGGYFTKSASATPLLHLWSLSIEEQFYIFFPLLLYFSRNANIRIIVISALCILSFIWNIYIHDMDRAGDFYSPFSRFWEILAGATLCAFVHENRVRTMYFRADAALGKIFAKKPQENDGHCLSLVLAVIGTFFLVVALLVVHGGDRYPGWKALLPTIGTTLLIAAGPLNFISKHFLCNRVAIFIGIISYPLYLWHWVLISFAYIIMGGFDKDTLLLRVSIVAVSLLLSWVTYLFVETPIRFNRVNRKAKTVGLAITMTIVGLLGLGLGSSDGFPDRYLIKKYNTLLELSKYAQYTDDAGLAYAGIGPGVLLYCRFYNTNSDKTVAIIGDSYVTTAFYGIAKLGETYGFNTVTLGWIVPSGEIWRPDLGYNKDIIMKILESKKDIHKVFFVSRGMLYITGMHDPITGIVHNEIEWGWAHPVDINDFKRSLQEYVDKLNSMGKQVYVIAENPMLSVDPRNYLSRPLRPKKLHEFPDTLRSNVLKTQEQYLKILDEIHGATIIQTIPTFCPTEICLAFDESGLPLFQDGNHLSIVGSHFQAERILKPYLLEQ